MREVIVTGATGFIGRQVLARLRQQGWTPIGVSRDPARAARTAPLATQWLALDSPALDDALHRVGRCINLVGQHPFGARWSAAYKALMRASRVDATRRIARALSASTAESRVLVSTSGTSVYGDCGDEAFGEERPCGPAWFLADMERDWEEAARSAEPSGVRVALLRVGLALGRDGGALQILEQNFQRRMGGHVGTGRQFVPWIDNHDCARMYVDALEDERWRGAFNCTSPEPRTFAELCTKVGTALGRSSWFHAPPWAARLMIGEASAILLESQRALPRRAEALGFRFEHPTLEGSIAHVYGAGATDAVPLAARGSV